MKEHEFRESGRAVSALISVWHGLLASREGRPHAGCHTAAANTRLSEFRGLPHPRIVGYNDPVHTQERDLTMIAAKPSPPAPLFTSAEPFEAERIGAAAVYCSDGRWGDQMDEFLHHGLGFPRYDRVAVPGGPACLASYIQTLREEGALEKQLRFLVMGHELQRIVLIAHQDCLFYKQVRIRAGSVERQQFEDLAKVAPPPARLLGRSARRCLFRPEGGRVCEVRGRGGLGDGCGARAAAANRLDFDSGGPEDSIQGLMYEGYSAKHPVSGAGRARAASG